MPAWLRGQRGKAKQDEIVARLESEQGVKISRAWLSRAENGAPISPDLLAAFQRLYGSEPPEHEEAPPRSVTDEAGLLTDIALAIRELVAELRATRQALPSQADWARTLVAAYDSGDTGDATPPSDAQEPAGAPESPPVSEPATARQSEGPDGDG